MVRLPVNSVVLQQHGTRSPRQFGILLGSSAPNVVAFLLLVRFFVLVLEMQKQRKPPHIAHLNVTNEQKAFSFLSCQPAERNFTQFC